MSLSTSTLPSLLVFGPQTELPPEKALQDCRQELLDNPQLSALRNAVDQLPQLWQKLVSFDPGLQKVPGDKYLSSLKTWIANGGPFPHRDSSSANHYGLAVTVLLQTTQYVRYLATLGQDAHRRVLESVQSGGVQGFCVGFLSAAAVASAKNEDDLGLLAAVALRLAVCIGAYVDADGAYAAKAESYVAMAVRWQDGQARASEKAAEIIQSIPGVGFLGCPAVLFDY